MLEKLLRGGKWRAGASRVPGRGSDRRHVAPAPPLAPSARAARLVLLVWSNRRTISYSNGPVWVGVEANEENGAKTKNQLRPCLVPLTRDHYWTKSDNGWTKRG